MAWSIAEVAKMARVTSRTLRHYDATGLLPPAYVGSNGYRYYEQAQLLRLQEILLLRELGLGLPAVAEVVDGQTDRVTALRSHEQALRAEGSRLSRLADTVRRTVVHLEGGADMPAEQMFEGFAEQRAQFEEEMVAEHGEAVREHFRQADQVIDQWTEEDRLAVQAQTEVLDRRLAAVLRSGADPGSVAAQKVVAEHYGSVTQFWTPDATAYTNLGQMYVDDPRFRQHYDAVDPALAPWLAEAMAAYARNQLA